MTAAYGVVGLLLLTAAITWHTSPYARVQLRRAGTALLTAGIAATVIAAWWGQR